jgi:hypothetical protein
MPASGNLWQRSLNAIVPESKVLGECQGISFHFTKLCRQNALFSQFFVAVTQNEIGSKANFAELSSFR